MARIRIQVSLSSQHRLYSPGRPREGTGGVAEAFKEQGECSRHAQEEDSGQQRSAGWGAAPLGAIDPTRKVRTNPLTDSLIPFPRPPVGLCSYLNTEAGHQVCVVQGNGLWPSLWDK